MHQTHHHPGTRPLVALLFTAVLVTATAAQAQEITGVPGRPAPPPPSTANNSPRPTRSSAA